MKQQFEWNLLFLCSLSHGMHNACRSTIPRSLFVMMCDTPLPSLSLSILNLPGYSAEAALFFLVSPMLFGGCVSIVYFGGVVLIVIISLVCFLMLSILACTSINNMHTNTHLAIHNTQVANH